MENKKIPTSPFLKTKCTSHLSFERPSFFFLFALLFSLIETVPSYSKHSVFYGQLCCASLDLSNSKILCIVLKKREIFCYGRWRLRLRRTDVVIEAVDRLEALLTPSWPGCCSHVNKHGERASGVIRPKRGGFFSLPSWPLFQWVVWAVVVFRRFKLNFAFTLQRLSCVLFKFVPVIW